MYITPQLSWSFCRRGGQVLRRVRLFLGGRAVAGRLLQAGKRVPGKTGKDRPEVLSVHSQQQERMPIPEPQGPQFGDHVSRDPVDAHVLHHARVLGGRRQAVAEGNSPTDPATVRCQRRNHRLGTGFGVTVHAGRGQHTDGGQDNSTPDKRDKSK